MKKSLNTSNSDLPTENKKLTEKQKRNIEYVVNKVIDEYGETLRLLGNNKNGDR